MSGKLYLVSTPIGNLGDMTIRGLEVLREVDFIAVEDTRITLRLLNHFEIKKPLYSYYEHNSRESGERILARLLGGESCALVSDAGTPAISDPGEELVRLCAEQNVEVVSVPGACALVSALSVSALSSQRFCFEGFLSTAKKSRRERLELLHGEERTIVFYEAPHKLRATLSDLYETLGDRRIVICRELTKLHEEIIRTALSDAAGMYAEHPPRGEFVLIIEGAPEPPVAAMALEDAVEMAKPLLAQGVSSSAAAKKAALLSGRRKSEIYRQLMKDEK